MRTQKTQVIMNMQLASWSVPQRIATAILIMLSVAPTANCETYKQLPPDGIDVDADVRDSLLRRIDDIDGQTRALASSSADASAWIPDIEVLTRAVRLAIELDNFYKKSEIDNAAILLEEAQRRLSAVADGKRGLDLLHAEGPGSDEPILAVGGFRSRIDGSVQPYGLVIPAGYQPGTGPRRLDVWLHGRGDTKTEIPFLTERMTKVGQYAPADTFVLHPFGRHCVAFKFAGETDVYESISHVRDLVSVDPDRIAMRGFSMGGAGVWHLGVHDPGSWFAVNPGAGFVDTIVYQGWTEETPFEMTKTRQALMNWYDVLPWVTNLGETNLIAYSGEVDKQRQAAERVTSAAKENGIEFQHIIGKDMGHKIDEASAVKIDSLLAELARHDAPSPPKRIDFTTYLLRYHQVDWLSIEGLVQQFRQGRVRAEILGDESIKLVTEGVTRLRLDFADSGWPGVGKSRVMLNVDGQTLEAMDGGRADGLQCDIVRVADGNEHVWKLQTESQDLLRKRPGLQGPIDDAFCESFIFVSPSRPATHGVVQRWIDREMKYATQRWRTLMRGNVRWVKDTELTDQMIASANLVCFGDFTSNRYLAGIADRLPIRWTKENVVVGDRKFDPVASAPVFCYPNPRNPNRYLVVNSGMTFREFSNVSNSRQIPMLPDWAVLNVSGADDSIFAGKVVADGFFDEQWKIKSSDASAND